MPLELGIWRIDSGTPQEVPTASMDKEARLEDILAADISIASPNWMVIGRQVRTDFGGYIDLLAIDRDGKLIVIELKKNMTPREVVAQLLDYASWVQELRADDISRIFDTYQEKWIKNGSESLDAAFCAAFQTAQMPEAINEAHELVVVAAELDDPTERIVTYLTETHSVPINAVFFRVFKDGDRELLTRAWFRDPTGTQMAPEAPISGKQWNGEYYVSFWDGFKWDAAIKHGYIAAGGGEWYSRTLRTLEPGGRIWVNMSNTGYVGVGTVTGESRPVGEFLVEHEGKDVPISTLPDVDPALLEFIDDKSKQYYLVPVQWIKTVPRETPIKETGFFGNQNSACRPRDDKWVHTVKRLKKRFVISD